MTCVIRTMDRAKISLEMKIESKALLQVGFSTHYIGMKFTVSKSCVWNVA